MKRIKKILILGPNSEIARDMIKKFNSKYFIFFMSHRKQILNKWLKQNKIKNYKVINSSKIKKSFEIDVILNFIGSGDPKKTSNLKEEFSKINNQYDNMCIDYLKNNKKTKYIYFSSGSIFTKLNNKPINDKSKIYKKDIFNSVYKKIKYFTEKKHRRLKSLKIFDLRIFNYFSASQNLNNSFFICQIIKSILKKGFFKTSSTNFYRDYIGADDLFSIITRIINMDLCNNCFDICSKKIISKKEIINYFKKNYQLNVKYTDNDETNNKFYYSTNYKLFKLIKFKPKFSSMDTIEKESKKILKNLSV